MNFPLLFITVVIAASVVAGGAFVLSALGMDDGLSFLTSISFLLALVLFAFGYAVARRMGQRLLFRIGEHYGFVTAEDRKKHMRQRTGVLTVFDFGKMVVLYDGEWKLALGMYVALREQWGDASARQVAKRMKPLAGLGVAESFGDGLGDVLRAFVPAAVRLYDEDIPPFAQALARVGRGSFTAGQTAEVLKLDDPVYAVKLMETGVSPEYIVALA